MYKRQRLGYPLAVIDCDFPQYSLYEMRERDSRAVLENEYLKRAAYEPVSYTHLTPYRLLPCEILAIIGRDICSGTPQMCIRDSRIGGTPRLPHLFVSRPFQVFVLQYSPAVTLPHLVQAVLLSLIHIFRCGGGDRVGFPFFGRIGS